MKMALRFAHDDILPPNTTAIGIEKDNKNAQYAVRWAIDNLVATNPFLVLVHVKQKNMQHQAGSPNGGVADGLREPTEAEHTSIFAQYRGYCTRRRIQLKEVIVENNDIAKGLLDFININYMSNIVVGASTRGALSRSRKSKNDISTALNKSGPDFCSVYVISKGKLLTVRSAQRTAVNTAVPPRQPLGPLPHLLPDCSPEDAAGGRSLQGGRKSLGSERMPAERMGDRMPQRERIKSAPTNIALENVDLLAGGRNSARSSFSDEPEALDPLSSFGSMDMTSHNMNFSPAASETPRDSAHGTARDMEAEMRRLKLELKQTMELYSSACKEALLEKKKAKELQEWKMEEARRFEEARLAEEAALAVAEAEKAKCRAAMESADAAQRQAEMEVRRRRYAELKATREAEEKNRALTALHKNDSRYRKYTIEEIEAATEKFADSNKIGEGGYGPVYKGKLDHTAVAIKVLRPEAAQGRKQFNQEVEVLSCIRHPNMVLLLGACPEYGCLVYEHLNNGSLEDRLFRRGGTPSLPWKLRFKIAAEIATALQFLHQTKPEPLVHRDLKPANILLDRNYVSKISDVGLARLVPPSVADSVTQYHMTSAAGTFCYIDPEYQQTGMLGIKSDIYSLWIVLLQIITARPPMALSHHVDRSIEKGTFAEMLDPTVPDWPMEETISFAKVALKCSELRKKDRPDLGSVVLPELKRIRDFGSDHESNGSSDFGQGSYSHSMRQSEG